MKYILAAIIASSVQAVKVEGIPKPDIMQEQPSHWRKVWPQGIIDDSTNDADVLDMFNTPLDRKKKKVIPKETYAWTLSDDVKET